MFLPEERRGRNCTGRVPGKDQHKGQLTNLIKLIIFGSGCVLRLLIQL